MANVTQSQTTERSAWRSALLVLLILIALVFLVGAWLYYGKVLVVQKPSPATSQPSETPPVTSQLSVDIVLDKICAKNFTVYLPDDNHRLVVQLPWETWGWESATSQGSCKETVTYWYAGGKTGEFSHDCKNYINNFPSGTNRIAIQLNGAGSITVHDDP